MQRYQFLASFHKWHCVFGILPATIGTNRLKREGLHITCKLPGNMDSKYSENYNVKTVHFFYISTPLLGSWRISEEILENMANANCRVCKSMFALNFKNLQGQELRRNI